MNGEILTHSYAPTHSLSHTPFHRLSEQLRLAQQELAILKVDHVSATSKNEYLEAKMQEAEREVY